MSFGVEVASPSHLQEITTNVGLNDTDFDAKLCKKEQFFLDGFRYVSQVSQEHTMYQKLKRLLFCNRHPLLVALKLFANCPDSTNVQMKGLSYIILDNTCKLYRKKTQFGAMCDDNTRMVAFNFVKTSGVQSLIKAMIETYQLMKIKNLVVPKIREMLGMGFYKESAQWIINIELTNEFQMLELVFPLIALNQVSMAEWYLDTATHQRLALVKFLDSLLHKDKSVIEMCHTIIRQSTNISASSNVFSYRPIYKLVGRLAKKYRIDISNIPNCIFKKSCMHLQFMYRSYQNGIMSVEAYREQVLDIAIEKPIQIHIVAYIAAHDRNEALMWHTAFQLTTSECPKQIKHFITENSEYLILNNGDHVTNRLPISVPNKTDYLTLDISKKNIIFVDTNIIFDRMLKHLATVKRIYFDSEWQQYISHQNKLCLIQIATYNNVYLIDCLSTELDMDKWKIFGSKVWNNRNILKVGFSIEQDLAMLRNSLPINLSLTSLNQYFDLRNMWHHLKTVEKNLMLPYGCIKNAGNSLSELSSFCLGKKLNKTNRCSNWANRPLRSAQVIYAALDTRCLVLILNIITSALKKKSVSVGKTFDKVIEVGVGQLVKCLCKTKD